MPPHSDQRAGLVYGFTAYVMWGLLPLYWHVLSDVAPSEILAHRMLWSLPVAAVILIALRRGAWIRPLLRQPKRLAFIALCTLVISANWYLYIWAVNAGHVLEASLGYFINPLVSIAFGVLVLRERLRPMQWVAVGVGAVSVLVMAIAYGRVPWIALALALSFATYGLIKKRYVKLDGIEGFSAETALQFLPALGFLVFLQTRGETGFTSGGVGQALLLAGCGVATAVPLICFGASAVRVPLTTLGMMQYLAPTFQFVLGLLVFHEEMPPERWAGFALVWLALVILTWDALRTARTARAAREAAAARAAREAATARAAAAPVPSTVAPVPSTAAPAASASGTTNAPETATPAETAGC
ncbi:EamA family transporter RarD [Streptomyces sp. NPDC003077]|uniref:EamA family transporter RarD n=1 Tax=Streptomyces sp. NPDC003077 TaxID=3154443 RepID=UPI0033AB960A